MKATQLANLITPFFTHPPAANHVDEIRDNYAKTLKVQLKAAFEAGRQYQMGENESPDFEKWEQAPFK